MPKNASKSVAINTKQNDKGKKCNLLIIRSHLKNWNDWLRIATSWMLGYACGGRGFNAEHY